MKKESFIYSTLTIGGSKEQVNEVMKYICDDIYDIGSIDLNKICAVPVHLNIGPDDEVSCGEKLYRHYLDLVPYPTEEEEENFLAVLSRADQRRFLLGKMAVLNRKEYGYPTYTGWCTEHWGTDENVISFEECNENSIAFLTHSAPASEAIHTLSILFPKVKWSKTILGVNPTAPIFFGQKRVSRLHCVSFLLPLLRFQYHDLMF